MTGKERGIRALGALVIGSLVVTGCWSIAQYGFEHHVAARFGPCQASKDSVRAALGAPRDEVYGDVRDDAGKMFEHEWGYPIEGDSIRAVSFMWVDGGDRCVVAERRMSRGEFGRGMR